jgi:ceramide glucosyltransferase
MEHQLRENLTAFLHQDHPNFEITFVVERATDPAVQLIRNLQKENRCIQTKLVIAGRTEECGQKVHNLRRATEDLPIDVDVLVFADSDANPKTTWLRWIVNRVGRENLGARTGYRWMIPKNKKVPTLLGCTINNALASFLGRGKHYLVWGGSWAIHRNIFDAVGIREAWSGVLSDDLVASRALKTAKLEIEFEPQCVCTTVVEFNWSTLTEFMRRQLLIGRRYSPMYWLGAMVVVVTTQIGFWGGLIGGILAVAAGYSIGYWALLSSAGLYLLGVARAVIRQNIGRSNAHAWRNFRRARKFDMFCGPFTGLVTAALLLASTFGNTISWRGIKYFVGRGGRVLLVGRKLETTQWPVDTREGPVPAGFKGHPHHRTVTANATVTRESAKAESAKAESAIAPRDGDAKVA